MDIRSVRHQQFLGALVLGLQDRHIHWCLGENLTHSPTQPVLKLGGAIPLELDQRSSVAISAV